MLQAAAFAIQLADTCQMSANANATFQAGVYDGFTDEDLRAQLEACLAPDQDIANDAEPLAIAADKSFNYVCKRVN